MDENPHDDYFEIVNGERQWKPGARERFERQTGVSSELVKPPRTIYQRRPGKPESKS